MVQPPGFNGLSFDPFSLQQDGLTASEVDVGRCEITQALVISMMIVIIDERRDLSLEVTGQEVVLQKDAVLQCLMPAFDLALCLRMVGGTTDMAHVFVLQPISQVAGDVWSLPIGSIAEQRPSSGRHDAER